MSKLILEKKPHTNEETSQHVFVHVMFLHKKACMYACMHVCLVVGMFVCVCICTRSIAVTSSADAKMAAWSFL